MRSPTLFARVTGGVAIAVALATATSCSSPPSSTTGGEGDTTLSLMIWDPAQTPGVQKAVDGFQANHPGIKVDLQQVPQDQYYTKLDASLGAGEGPDVMWQSSKAPDYVDGGALQPLNEYIERDNISLDAYPPELTKLYEFDGKQYGMPKDRDGWVFVYNTEVFKKLGVTDVPTPDWTWEDMVRIGEQVKAKQSAAADVPVYYQFQFNNGVASLIHALGGTVIKDGKSNVSTPEGVKALGMIKDLQDQGLIPKIADAADYSAVQSLIAGTLAMGEIPSWNLSLLSKADVPDGTFKVVRLPSVNGSWATDTNGLSYVMNANSKNKDAAWELIKFLTSDEGAILHAEGGASPPANLAGAAQDAWVKANEKLDGLGEALAAMRQHEYLRTSTEYPKTRAPLPELESTVMGPYWAGSMSAEEAAAKIDEIFNKALG